MDDVTRLQGEIRDELAEFARLQREVPSGSNAEARHTQLDSSIASAERELSALEELQQGRRFWPSENT